MPGGKFCVFEQMDENASPIVTEEEKLASIWKAEWRKHGCQVLFAGLWLLLMLIQLFTQFFGSDF